MKISNVLLISLPLTLFLCSFTPGTIINPIDVGPITVPTGIDTIIDIPSVKETAKTNYILIGPYETDQYTHVSGSVTFGSGSKLSLDLQKYEIKVYYLDIETEEYILFGDFIGNTSILFSCSYLEKYCENEYKRSAYQNPIVKIVYSVYESTTISTKYFDVKCHKYESFYNIKYDEPVTTTEQILYYSDENGITYISETFNFINKKSDYCEYLNFDNSIKQDYRIASYSLNIDLDNYQKPDVPSSMGRFILIDNQDVFKNIAPNHILILEDECDEYYDYRKNEYCMRADKKFYIEPSTRILYNDYKEGRILTDRFYFPNNIAKTFNEKYRDDCYFIIGIRAGYTNAHLIRRIDFKLSENNVIGSCDNSGYCVSVEDSDPDFSIGTNKDI